MFRRLSPALLVARTSMLLAKAAEEPGAGFEKKFLVPQSRSWYKVQAGKHCSVYVDSGTIAWIVMDRVGSSANAIGDEFMDSLSKAVDETDKIIAAKKASVAVITSAKDTFCVGADIDQMYPVTDKKIAYDASRKIQTLFNRIENSKYPMIAAINGLALGGGCELALACHHRVIAENASLGQPETMLGLLPGGGGCVRLQRLVGVQEALGWILKGGPVKAPRCRKVGAVDTVIPNTKRYDSENPFFEGARGWIGRKLVDKPLSPAKPKKKPLMAKLLENNSLGRKLIARITKQNLDKTTKGKYIGHYYALECVLFAASNPPAQAYEHEAKKFSELLVMPEAKNQITLYFLDEGTKKLENKTGMEKKNIPLVKSIGVIGAGVMGSGIAHYFANKSTPVAIKDISEEAVNKGLGMIRSEFASKFKKKKDGGGAAAKKEIDQKMVLVKGGTTDTIFKDCDILIEAAVEMMDVKKKLLTALETGGILDGKKIFATNTSSLSITDLQSVSKYPQNVVGMHFFNPVKRMPLVEVIKGKKTSKEAAAMVYQLALKSGKKPIIVGDCPGFLVNRILGGYMAEAVRLVKDGADAARVDRVIRDFGMPMGPFRLVDEVGIDVACHVGPVLTNGLKSDRFKVDDALNTMVKDGLLGKKNSKGFYRYDDRGKERGMDTSVITNYLQKSPNSAFPAADILDRQLMMMFNEAAFLLQEGIAACPEDIDVGMVWGTGFPPFRGGLLQCADHRGVKSIVDRMNQLRDQTKREFFTPAQLLVDMAKNNKRFYPNRPFVPYVERKGSPHILY